jgi:hypothetical protein
MKLTMLAGAALAASPAGAAAEEARPSEHAGRTFEIVTPSGVTNIVTLRTDGSAIVIPRLGSGLREGHWMSKPDALCVRFIPRGEECWDASALARPTGNAITVRSDRGQDLRIRLLNGAEEQPGASR